MSVFRNFKWDSFGILLLRVLMGLLAMNYGIHYLIGGMTKLMIIGAHVSFLPFCAFFWGITAALVYTIGGLFVILGLWFRYICFLFAIMMVAILWQSSSILIPNTPHALTVCILSFSFVLIGPGEYYLDV